MRSLKLLGVSAVGLFLALLVTGATFDAGADEVAGTVNAVIAIGVILVTMISTFVIGKRVVHLLDTGSGERRYRSERAWRSAVDRDLARY